MLNRAAAATTDFRTEGLRALGGGFEHFDDDAVITVLSAAIHAHPDALSGERAVGDERPLIGGRRHDSASLRVEMIDLYAAMRGRSSPAHGVIWKA